MKINWQLFSRIKREIFGDLLSSFYFSCLPEKIGYLYVQGYDQPFSQMKVNESIFSGESRHLFILGIS